MAGNLREKIAKHNLVPSTKGSFQDPTTAGKQDRSDSLLQPQNLQAHPQRLSRTDAFDQPFADNFDESGVTPDPDPFGMNMPIQSTTKQPGDSPSPNPLQGSHRNRPGTIAGASQSLPAGEAPYATIRRSTQRWSQGVQATRTSGRAPFKV